MLSNETITTLFINSKDANSGSATNFTYNLPQGIGNIVSYYVKNVTIPFSQYVSIYRGVYFGNETIGTNSYFQLVDTSGTWNVILTPGNYNASQLATLLQNALNMATAIAGNPYTVAYNSSTYKYTISSSGGAFTLNWQINNNAPGQYAAYSFGFPNVQSTGAALYLSPNVANLNGSSLNYYIRSSTLTLGNSYSYFQDIKDTVVIQVPINVPPGSYILYKNDNPDFINLSDATVRTIDIQLVDEYGNIVNLNGLNWNVTLVFKNKF